VDIDYYILAIREGRAKYIPEMLVNIGYNDSRVTESCLGNPVIEIPEALLLYQKHGDTLRRGLTLYNAWWRLVRNLELRAPSDLERHAQGITIPVFLRRIVDMQALIPVALLRNHVISFLCMTLHYPFNRR
jgi:hypothetical protein